MVIAPEPACPNRIAPGLPEPLRREAARLLLDAFAAKLRPALGRGERAELYLAGALRPEKALAALDAEGRLLGLAGLQDGTGGMTGGGRAELRAQYGAAGAFWRGALLALFERVPPEGEMLLEAVAVRAEARGAGIGTALVEAAAAEAARRGLSAIRLEVVDSNPRAQALYERLGFVVDGAQSFPLLRPVFGFGGWVTMRRPVAPPRRGPG